VADRFPELIRRIADAGHEIASHGYHHRLVYDLTPDEFREGRPPRQGLRSKPSAARRFTVIARQAFR
jgi:peptidoglycan/xylan/chitin deacetylase (PgdA/CDA1 family)